MCVGHAFTLHLTNVPSRWQILGLHLRPRKGRHRLHDPRARRTHRQHLLRTSPRSHPPPALTHAAQTDPCGLQLFHLLAHTEGTGGATLLVDGFYVASILRELYPHAYATLTRVGVPAHAAGEPGALYTPFPARAHPVLREQAGELVQVRWNNDDRSVMDHLSAAEMEEW